MTMVRSLFAAAFAAGLLTSPVLAEHPRDQDQAFRAANEGRAIPLPQIRDRVAREVGNAEYLGPEFRGDTYRLKFVRDGHVMWVDVDAATGRIVGRSR